MLLIYTIPYLLVIISIMLYHSAKPYDIKGLCIFSFVLIACFSGFSYDVGWDYIMYEDSMRNKSIERYELLERMLLSFCIESNFPQLFFIVNHAIISLLIMLSVKKATKEPYMAILAYICLPFMFLFAFSTIRAALVMALTLFAYEYALKGGRWSMYVVLIIIGFFIHHVSLAGLLLLPLHYLKLGRYFNILIIIISYIIMYSNIIMNIPFLNAFAFLEETYERFEFYTDSGGAIGGQSLIHLVYLFFIVINLLFYKKLSVVSKAAPKYILFVTVGYCLHLLFQYNPVFSSRFSRSFYVFEILLIPSYIIMLSKMNIKLIREAVICILLFLFVYQLTLHNYNGYEYGRVSTYLPYRFYFLQ